MARPPKAKAIEHLTKTLVEIPQLNRILYGSPERMRGSPQFRKWYRDTCIAITNTFGDDSEQLATFQAIPYSPQTWPARASDEYFQPFYIQGLGSAVAIISSMIKEINEYWPDENQVTIPVMSQTQGTDHTATKKVFVAHGRDEAAKESVARFLQKVGLEPVILSELPARGQTIIEKFKSNSDVRFAVALLTPDDAGSRRGETEPKPRARQNVIFELGFFIGSLGRDKVCALTKGEPEIPSNYAGVEYISLDESGGWQMKLVGELKAAGFDVDANRAFSA